MHYCYFKEYYTYGLNLQRRLSKPHVALIKTFTTVQGNKNSHTEFLKHETWLKQGEQKSVLWM